MGGSSKIILGMLLGGMITVDMGGPINKAAYVFGTASIASGNYDMGGPFTKAAYVFGTAAIAAGNYDIMAAVMIGGMVPPLAIALATFFFKNRFTEKEQQTTLTNIIMELSFITEGSIPFAASDPLHILPACVVGSIVGMFGLALLKKPLK